MERKTYTMVVRVEVQEETTTNNNTITIKNALNIIDIVEKETPLPDEVEQRCRQEYRGCVCVRDLDTDKVDILPIEPKAQGEPQKKRKRRDLIESDKSAPKKK